MLSGWRQCLLCAALSLCLRAPLAAQGGRAPGHAKQAPVSVEFVGCRSVGQAEALEAPKRASASLPIPVEAANRLAYYGSALDLVLAPKGWTCLGIYGSGGDFLLVSAQPIDVQKVYDPQGRGFDGPIIELSNRHGDQFGDRLEKAQIIARIFPSRKALVARLMRGFDIPASEIPFGPHSTDSLVYKSNEVVEYTTPAHAEGLGTEATALKASDNSIRGAVILRGNPPDLVMLSVRLPGEAIGLASAIIGQVEDQFAASTADKSGDHHAIR